MTTTVIAVVGLMSAAGAAWASTITQPNTSPFAVPGDASGNPVAFTVVATGFTPTALVFVEQCDGTAPSTPGWSPTANCDLGSSPAPVIVDGTGTATFLSTDANHAFVPFKGESPQSLFNCLSPSDPALAPINGLTDFRNCQMRVSTNNGLVTSDQSFLRLQLPNAVAATTTTVAPTTTTVPPTTTTTKATTTTTTTTVPPTTTTTKATTTTTVPPTTTTTVPRTTTTTVPLTTTTTTRATTTTTAAKDTTSPACTLMAVLTGPPKAIQVTTSDSGSGLASIVVTKSTNASTPVPPFTAGVRTPVVVTATKINQALAATIALRVTDVAGNVTNCDPTLTTLSGTSHDTVTNVAAKEHYVTVTNGTPGLSVSLDVNGHVFPVVIPPAAVTTVDVASAMHAGSANTIGLSGTGRGTATVLVWEGNGTGAHAARPAGTPSPRAVNIKARTIAATIPANGGSRAGLVLFGTACVVAAGAIALRSRRRPFTR